MESVVRERFPPAAEEPDAPLMALGADSLDVRGLAEGLRAALGVDLDAAQLLSYSTLAALRDHLAAELGAGRESGRGVLRNHAPWGSHQGASRARAQMRSYRRTTASALSTVP